MSNFTDTKVDSTYGPQFKVNNNGNSANDIRDDYEAVFKAARALDEALGNAGANALHGRNYQTCGEDRMVIAQNDQAIMRRFRTNSEEIGTFALAGIARAVRQREDL